MSATYILVYYLLERLLALPDNYNGTRYIVQGFAVS
jgi:hypothetical protein